MSEQHKAYNAFVAETIGADKGLTVGFRSEPAAVRFDPGLIVDLPAFTIQQGGTIIASGRLCLTVCMHESRSKIWSRISSVKDATWGNNPCEQLQTLIERSRSWFNVYANSVKQLYAKQIEQVLASTSEPHPSVDLSVRNKMELISADTSLHGLSNLSAAIANHERIDRDKLTHQAAVQLDAMVRCIPDTGIATDPSSVLSILNSETSNLGPGRYYLVPHRTAREFRGVYVVQSLADRLLFAGTARLIRIR